MEKKLTFVKTWEASGNAVFEPDMIVAKAYKTVFASYRPKHFLYYQKNNKNKLGEAYDSREEMNKFNDSGYKDFKNQNYLKKYFKGITVAIKHNEKTTQSIEKENLEVIPKSKLAKFFELSIESMKVNFSYYLACQPERFTQFEQMAQERISKFVQGADAGESFRILATSTESTPLADEQIDWLKLVLKVKKEKLYFSGKKFDQLLTAHHRKYAILGASDGKDSWSKNHFVDKLRRDRHPVLSIQSELKEILARGQKLKKKQKNLIKKYQISLEVQNFCSLLAKIGHIRLQMRIKGWMPLYESMKKIIHAIAKKYDYNYGLIRFCTVDELVSLSRGQIISKDLLEKRSECFLLVYEYPDVTILSGKIADDRFREFVPVENLSNIDNVKGTIAMKGKIVGKVLLFQWGDDMNEKIKKITKNEKFVLVTGQTRPQIMPLIVKCSAIVTDEGGITSHSAIVSRELGIPCVVGTRIATRVFKDGDRVEVDANTGIIRILK